MATQYENDCGVLIHGEMQHGIAERGLFHSPHEGLGVLEEEITEAHAAALGTEDAYQDFKVAVFTDNLPESLEAAKQVAADAQHLMIEAMQVAAMARKFIKTFGDMKT